MSLSIDFPVDANTVHLIQFIFKSESQRKRDKEQERNGARECEREKKPHNDEAGCQWFFSSILCI